MMKVVRIAGGAGVFFSGAFAWYIAWSLPYYTQIIESMVEGGVSSMPFLQRGLLYSSGLLQAGIILVVLLVVGLLCYLTRALPVLITAGLVTLGFILAATWTLFSMRNILEVIIRKFSA